VTDDRLITIGCVMTNQARKDWGLAAGICHALRNSLPNVRFWWHVDVPMRHWSIPALLADYRLEAHVEVTTPPLADVEMANRYRTCDLTILPSLGEGFGYPIFESFACGVPCIHGNYAGGASLMNTCGLTDYLVEASMERLDTQHNCIRPVFAVDDWVTQVMDVLHPKGGVNPISQQVEPFSWLKLVYPWRRWLREGLGDLHE
jgi:glycosyltransferase involved in cell wall biosynthesis